MINNMKWIKEFPFRSGGVVLLMLNKKTNRWRPKDVEEQEYKVVEDYINTREYTPDNLPCYFNEYVKKGKMVYRILENGNYETFEMSRTNFSNVLAYMFKNDMIEAYE